MLRRKRLTQLWQFWSAKYLKTKGNFAGPQKSFKINGLAAPNSHFLGLDKQKNAPQGGDPYGAITICNASFSPAVYGQ
jgi:hypothetical protein